MKKRKKIAFESEADHPRCVHLVTPVVTSGHVINMAVTPFDPIAEPPCYMQTSWLYVW